MKTNFILLLIICSLGLSAQKTKDINDINNISLSIIMPDNIDGLSSRAMSKIESKIQHIVTQNGISGQGYTNDFLIYPKFEIYDDNVIEGMRNIHQINADFNLFIKQYKTGRVFSSYVTSISGAGLSKEKAIINAISKISTRDKKLKEFIESGKQKIINYYENNCNQYIADSDMAMKMKQYQKAIAILSTIPREAQKCYARIQDKSVQAYKAYQKDQCKRNIMKAKAKLAANSYRDALYYLQYIDPESPCGQEAKTLINQSAAKIDAKEKKEWDRIQKRYNDNIKMEKYRLDIMKEIAKSYFKSKPQTVIYKSLF